MWERTKKVSLILSIIMITNTSIIGQSYEIGHTSSIFNDSTRNRDISTEIFYPAEVAGQDVVITGGPYPVLIFGHGFVMTFESYDNFWNELVPQGYIMVFPGTEEGFTPDHGAFGLDLLFLEEAISHENTNNSSILFGAVENKSAVLGHSMGGGSSFLAAENNSNITTMINFAAAETTPSCISAATNVTIPALVFAGSEDCVASPIDNQIPMYDSLASESKTYISILGGGHCYFANSNFSCTLGESFCLPVVPISREEQQDVTFDLLTLWLGYYLKNDQDSFSAFNDSLVQSSRITYMHTSIPTGILSEPLHLERNMKFKAFPNPFNSSITINFDVPPSAEPKCSIYDLLGKLVWYQSFRNDGSSDGSFIWDGTSSEGVEVEAGLFIVSIKTEEKLLNRKILLLK